MCYRLLTHSLGAGKHTHTHTHKRVSQTMCIWKIFKCLTQVFKASKYTYIHTYIHTYKRIHTYTHMYGHIHAVAPSAGDWSIGSVVPIFSVTAAVIGITTAIFGPWMERAGPRMSNACGALIFWAGCTLTGMWYVTCMLRGHERVFMYILNRASRPAHAKCL